MQTQKDGGPVVVIHGLSPEDTLKAMRAVKAAMGAESDIAFASSTPTNLSWKLDELIAQVRAEHQEVGANKKQG